MKIANKGKKTAVIGALLLPLAFCGGCETNPVNDYIRREKETRAVDVSAVERVDIHINVGDCTINYGHSQQAEVNCLYKVAGTGERKVSDALEHTKLRCETKDGVLTVDLYDPETGERINPNNINRSGMVSMSTDIDITLPKNVSFFAVNSSVGNIELNDMTGAFDLTANVGSIKISGMDLTADSAARASTGNVECAFNSAAQPCTAKLYTSVGDVIFDTQGADYEQVDSSKGFVKEHKEALVDGILTIELDTDVGDVKIRK